MSFIKMTLLHLYHYLLFDKVCHSNIVVCRDICSNKFRVTFYYYNFWEGMVNNLIFYYTDDLLVFLSILMKLFIKFDKILNTYIEVWVFLLLIYLSCSHRLLRNYSHHFHRYHSQRLFHLYKVHIFFDKSSYQLAL